VILYYGFALMKVPGNHESASFLIRSGEEFCVCWDDYNRLKAEIEAKKGFVRWLCCGFENERIAVSIPDPIVLEIHE
jgi:hypothetical protein